LVKKAYSILLVSLLFVTAFVVGCAGKEGPLMAKDGNTVKVHYTGKLEDGTIFDTSVEREPLEFTLGEGSLIPGFEAAVRGMRVGQSKVVTIPADNAYGQYRDELVMKIDQAQLPKDLEPEVGQQLQMQQLDGRTAVVIVTEVSENTITVDANHPLAGKDLIFEIEIVEIK
jgi:peptidylprolyl isomerase